MAERRTRRTTRHADEFPEEAVDDFPDAAEHEFPEETDDELVEDDELAGDTDEDPLEEEPEQADGDEGGGAGRRSRRDRHAGLTAAKAGQAGLRQIAELTGKQPEGVTGVEPAEDGWVVGVEVVEDQRIPSSTDILATYETEVGTDGELVSYRRVRRYTRGRGDDGDA